LENPGNGRGIRDKPFSFIQENAKIGDQKTQFLTLLK